MIAYWKYHEWPASWLHDDVLWYQFTKFHARFKVEPV